VIVGIHQPDESNGSINKGKSHHDPPIITTRGRRDAVSMDDVANLLMARLPAFRYRDLGSMATIGRKSAVAQVGAFKFSGLLAWLLWSLAHIYFLIGFRNRLVVAMNWCWNYVTFQRGTRLITGISGSRIEDTLPAVMTAPLTTADVSTAVSGRGVYIRSTAKLHHQRSPQHAGR
jgi:hypothetical protein